MKTLDQIAAELQGYDPQALSASDVNAFLSRLVEPVTQTETVHLFDALGRILAVDVVSPLSVPPHDNSAMDGYAFNGAMLTTANTPDAPLTLRVAGTALAGKAWTGTSGLSDCVKIMTGAIMPTGLDTVIPLEFVQHTDDTHISFPANLLRPGDNRRLKGEDLIQGQSALQKGEHLTPAALGLMASLGIASVTVFRQLKVAYFSTGDEVLSLGEPPREGAVYDSNRYTVYGLLTRLGCKVIDLGVVRDDPTLLEAAFQNAVAQGADAIISSGGVSVGEADHTKAMMKKLGDVAFWRIAMRPGRPMAVGRIAQKQPKNQGISTEHADDAISMGTSSYQKNSAVLFGLPGNPVAVMVTFLAFVRPALLQMMGSTAKPLPLLKARSTDALRKKAGRTEYQRGTVSTALDGSLTVKITGNQGSGVLSSMVQANGLIVLHHDQGNVNAGDTVDVMAFEGCI